MNLFVDGGYYKLAFESGLHALKAHKIFRKAEKNKAIHEKLRNEEIDLKLFLSDIKLELQSENHYAPGL
jgi:hypothetical protein